MEFTFFLVVLRNNLNVFLLCTGSSVGVGLQMSCVVNGGIDVLYVICSVHTMVMHSG